MAIATQAIVIEKILTRHNFTEEEATKIIDYVENQKGDFATKQDIQDVRGELKNARNELMSEIDGIKRDVNWLKWIVGLGFAGLLTIMLYLHADTKQEMKELKAETKEFQTEMKEFQAEMREFQTEMKEFKAEMREFKAEMKENQKLILQLIQKR